MIPEAALDEGLAVQIAELLTHPKLALKMSLAALKLGKPDAAEALAALVEELSGKGET
jgi:UDP-N-acetylglucosamine--N-acetylmuramyl-(pentapeptide) pyrophosphoryl-undecaprenol N-acetylglucosamine transferase